jgi:hypothetical protein
LRAGGEHRSRQNKIAGGMSPRARSTYPGKTTTIIRTESAGAFDRAQIEPNGDPGFRQLLAAAPQMTEAAIDNK